MTMIYIVQDDLKSRFLYNDARAIRCIINCNQQLNCRQDLIFGAGYKINIPADMFLGEMQRVAFSPLPIVRSSICIRSYVSVDPSKMA